MTQKEEPIVGKNPNNATLLDTDGIERAWMDECPGCKAVVSAIKHDFSLCGQLQNALQRIRQLEAAISTPKGEPTKP